MPTQENSEIKGRKPRTGQPVLEKKGCSDLWVPGTPPPAPDILLVTLSHGEPLFQSEGGTGPTPPLTDKHLSYSVLRNGKISMEDQGHEGAQIERTRSGAEMGPAGSP